MCSLFSCGGCVTQRRYRSSVGSLSRNGAPRGYCIMSSRRMLSPMFLIRYVPCPLFLSSHPLIPRRCAGSRTHLAKTSVVERFLLCRDTQYGPLPLHLPVGPWVHAQVLDTRRDVVSALQLDLFVVRSRKCHSTLTFRWTAADGHWIGKLLHRVQHPHARHGGRKLRSHALHPRRQRYPRILLSRTPHYVFHPLPRESAARFEMGVYSRVHWVWHHYYIHDGARALSFCPWADAKELLM